MNCLSAMLYTVVILDEAEQEIDDKLEYLARKCSMQAYYAIKEDMQEILDYMSYNPFIFSIYEKDITQRKAHLKRHRYKFLFFVEDEFVYITAFLHDLQDE